MSNDSGQTNLVMPSLSVILITKNEANNLADCLASLGNLPTEVIVVDNGSTDDTVNIARLLGATVVETDSWPGFGPQKNLALDTARCDWILSVDADERLTDQLRDQVKSALVKHEYDCYEIPRLSYFRGKPIRHGGWYPDYIVRLCKRGSARFSDDLVHESLIPKSTVGRLTTPLLHYSYRSTEDVERKIKAYSDAGAKQLFARGKRTNYIAAITHGAWAFTRTYMFRMAFIDGLKGFEIAVMNKRSSYLKYKKLIRLQQGKSLLE